MPSDPPIADNDEADLRVTPPKDVAAGIPGVLASLRHGQAQMGPVRTVNTLRLLNQTFGFDCPGCAWPDPAGGQESHAEFCENGAKAVAEEATLRRVTPEFFAEHPVSELAGHTDHWLGQQGRLTRLRPRLVHAPPSIIVVPIGLRPAVWRHDSKG